MVLVDTSVLIDFLKGKKSEHTIKYENILEKGIPFGITFYTYQELLQGVKSNKEFDILKDYLSTQKFYDLLHEKESFEKAAKIYIKCRKNGLTIRSTIDLIIAEIAIENNLYLLHNDSDFNNIAEIVKELKIY